MHRSHRAHYRGAAERSLVSCDRVGFNERFEQMVMQPLARGVHVHGTQRDACAKARMPGGPQGTRV